MKNNKFFLFIVTLIACILIIYIYTSFRDKYILNKSQDYEYIYEINDKEDIIKIK